MSIFTSSKNSFEGQQSDENVVVLLRQHWFVLIGALFAFLILFVIPFAAYAFLGQYINGLGLNSLFWFLVSIYIIFCWLGFFYKIMIYLLDTWIVTDHRIVNSRQVGFFNREIAEMRISRVQDISTSLNSPISTFLNFGDLEVQSAGTETKFLFKNLPNPNHAKEIIMQASNEFARRHPNGAETN